MRPKAEERHDANLLTPSSARAKLAGTQRPADLREARDDLVDLGTLQRVFVGHVGHQVFHEPEAVVFL